MKEYLCLFRSMDNTSPRHQAMQSAEPVWKALHPADTVLQKNQQPEQQEDQEGQEGLMQRQQSQRSGGTDVQSSEDEAAADGQGAGGLAIRMATHMHSQSGPVLRSRDWDQPGIL